MTRLRRAGAKWRLLVHEWIGPQPDGTSYGTSHDVTNKPGTDATWTKHHELPANTEFDELVVGSWLHVEQMDTGRWWMNVGGVTLWVEVDRDGRPLKVTTYAAGDYAEPVPGCVYQDGRP